MIGNGRIHVFRSNSALRQISRVFLLFYLAGSQAIEKRIEFCFIVEEARVFDYSMNLDGELIPVDDVLISVQLNAI